MTSGPLGIFSPFPELDDETSEEISRETHKINTGYLTGFAYSIIFLDLLAWLIEINNISISSTMLPAYRIWRVALLVAFTLGALALKYSEFFKKNPVLLFNVIGIPLFTMQGYAVGHGAGITDPFFYQILPMPVITIPIIATLHVRFFTTLAIPVFYFIGIMLKSTAFLSHPLVWNPLTYVGFVVVISIVIGHATSRLVLLSLAQRKIIARASEAAEKLVDERTTDLQKANRELRELAGHIAGVQEAERARIALDIHDELGQLLTGLRYELYGLQSEIDPAGQRSEQLVGTVNKINGIVGETMNISRRIISGLMPTIELEKGFFSTLASSFEYFSSSSKIKCDWKLDLGEDCDNAFSNEEKLLVFRIIQEALTNVARHSEASKVVIESVLNNGTFHLRIIDDGIGFDRDQSLNKGFGLIGLRERIRLLDGKLSINSSSSGTEIEAEIPLKTNTGENNDTRSDC